MILKLIEALFGERHSEQPSVISPETQSENKIITIVPQVFRDDVDNLKNYVGEENWKPGLEISLSLSELLDICPRERKRSDSYRKLIAYLDEEQQISVIIKTRSNYED